MKDTCKYIFEYATTSRCNGKTYANLYIELMEKYNVFKEEFNGNFESYIHLFDRLKALLKAITMNYFVN